MEQTITQQQSSGKGKKILLIGLGIAATGTLGYFGYQWYAKRKQTTTDAGDGSDNSFIPPPKNNFSVPSAPKRNDDFPLKKGSKGARVKQVQEVLIAKLGRDALGKAGADGDFGSKTEAALIKAGYPNTIDESTFNVMTQGEGMDVSATAKELYSAAIIKNFTGAIKALQKLKSKEDYTTVSDDFKTNYRIGGVRQTLVNGMLNSFTDEKQKQAIRLQFTRMGLGYDGKKWSLSGLDTSSIITKQETLVWVNPKTAIKVPANMVLGKEVAQRGKHTLFENKGKHFLVDTQSITFI
ncbi:MAG: hypothetical protein Q8T03_13350 [Bacteroidota bacterium]|nr:hypothetical protein [Bacteroidota bacterium]MDP3558352.1 hypothetical protein [Bacteroidota bacterium]